MVLKIIPIGVGLPIADGVKFINDAIEAAEQAKIVSTTAISTANTAKDSAEQTRVELDQAILSGDSSPLAGQLSVGSDAVTYPSAQERFLQERSAVTSELAETDEQLAKTYSASESFDPIVVAREKGKHIAFGSIARAATIAGDGFLNKNLIVYRSGISHELEGKIKGVYVSDTGYAIGEPFTIADPTVLLTQGRGGTATPNDFRDPNLCVLPDGRILLTFFAINLNSSNVRTTIESFAMIGTWNNTFRTMSWTTPTVLFPTNGKTLYGKPFVEGGYIYSAAYTGSNFDVGDGLERGYITRTTLTDPTIWEVIGSPIYTVVGAEKTEPVLRPRPNSGYFAQVRYEGSGGVKQLIRYDSDTVDGVWSNPVTIYTGSSHAKGLEILADGSYFTGIRLLTDNPGVGILTSNGSVETPVNLNLSGVVYTSQTGSSEAGYMEFMKLSDENYLAMFHSEAGDSIQSVNFTVSMIRNKKVKESDSAIPTQKAIGAERLKQLVHIGNSASRVHNLVTNPTYHIPYGFQNPPGWSGTTITKSDGLETESPGASYGKVTTSGGTVSTKPKSPYSRLFAELPIVAAVRIYCKTPNRVRCNVTFGTTRVSTYHEGGGWETLTVIAKGVNYFSFASEGTATDPISFSITTTVDSSITYFLDWATMGFGETIPEVANDSAERMMSIANITLTAKANTFVLSDLGFPSPAMSTSYIVNILDSDFEILGYSVSKTTTSFTITLTDGALWGSGKEANIEIIGI